MQETKKRRGKIETKCPKCRKIIAVDILLDKKGKARTIQKIA